MPKALYGFAGEPRAAMLLREVQTLKTQVKELESALEASKAELAAAHAASERDAERIDLGEGALA